MSAPGELPESTVSAVATRAALLDAAAAEIHIHGYQAASIARILAATGVTKGALYHHFPSKKALGYAVFDERFAPQLRAQWLQPLAAKSDDPLIRFIRQIECAIDEITEETLQLGCPINNLAQEMSPVDEGFRLRIERLLAEWREAIIQAMRRSRSTGRLRADVDIDAAAAFVVAAMEGCIGMAKNAQSKALLQACGRGLLDYLRALVT